MGRVLKLPGEGLCNVTSSLSRIRLASVEERISKLEKSVEEINETLEVLTDKKLLREIKRGLDDLKRGRYRDYRDVEELKKRFSAKQ